MLQHHADRPQSYDARPSPWSGNPAPSQPPERYGHERKTYNDQRDPDEIGVDSRRIPEAHVDVLFVPLVACVQDQEQPDHPEKRSEEQAEEAAHDLHDDKVYVAALPPLPGQPPDTTSCSGRSLVSVPRGDKAAKLVREDRRVCGTSGRPPPRPGRSFARPLHDELTPPPPQSAQLLPRRRLAHTLPLGVDLRPMLLRRRLVLMAPRL